MNTSEILNAAQDLEAESDAELNQALSDLAAKFLSSDLEDDDILMIRARKFLEENGIKTERF